MCVWISATIVIYTIKYNAFENVFSGNKTSKCYDSVLSYYVADNFLWNIYIYIISKTQCAMCSISA